MGKLSAEQKIANKAAQKIRDRAYAARNRAYRVAREGAEKAAEESVFAEKRNQAVEAVDQEWRNRNEALDAIRSEIAQLNEKLERTKQQYEISIEPKRQARNDAQSAFQAYRDLLLEEVDSAFLDMKNCWYVSQWQIPPEIQAEMKAAKILAGST